MGKGPLHQGAFIKPFFKVVAHHIGMEDVCHVEAAHVLHAPDGHGVFAGDKAGRFCARAFKTAGDEHAEGLVGEATLEGIGDKIMPVCAREGFHEQMIRGRNGRAQFLNLEPFADGVSQVFPLFGIVDHVAKVDG